MLQIVNVNEGTYKDAYNFLCSVPSITDVDVDILNNGVIVMDDDRVIGSISFELYDNIGLIRYFVFKKNLPNSILCDLLERLEANARLLKLNSLVCVADNVQIENLFKELNFFKIDSYIFINEEKIENTSFKSSSFLQKKLN